MCVESDAVNLTTHREMLRAVYEKVYESGKIQCLARVERFSENFKTLNQ